MYYAEIAPTRIVRKDQDSFTYASNQLLPIGSIVPISIGKTTGLGVIIRHVKKPNFPTKEVGADTLVATLPAPLVKTALWMSEYYSTPLATVLQTILPSGIQKKRRPLLEAEQAVKQKRTQIILNKDQLTGVQKIEENQQTSLLFGVTGSGKTAVYSEVARRALERQESVIILTPEISLTPQLVANFRSTFPRVVVSHSQMTEAARHHIWQEAHDTKEPLIIIGPRSALFLPVKKVGVIIIDESHEPTYKQEQSPKYDALRAARILATAHNAKLVLGSATPSVEDFYHAKKTNGIVALHQKISNQKTTIELVDLTNKEVRGSDQVFSLPLLKAIEETLASGKQVLLFHNRRGSAGLMMCEHCGWQALCDNCFTPLVLHADEHALRCHLCGITKKPLPYCPECKHPDVIFKGIGTKRIEETAQKLFPKARVMRFDGDTKDKDKFHHHYDSIVDNTVDIIIGTQQLAKGLHLPQLGLVGIIQADTGLLMPDYTAHERVFQLISQVAGRAGRQQHASRVIIQTYQATNPLIQEAANEAYESFYTKEISSRKKQVLPPFTHSLQLVVSYKTEKSAVKAARALSSQLQANSNLTILGPTPAFYERLRGTFRWQIIVKSANRQALQAIVKQLPAHWTAELDPKSYLA